jgi:hypothetical protein
MPLADRPDGQATVTSKNALAVITDSAVASKQVIMGFTFIGVLFLSPKRHQLPPTYKRQCLLPGSGLWMRLLCHVNTI